MRCSILEKEINPTVQWFSTIAITARFSPLDRLDLGKWAKYGPLCMSEEVQSAFLEEICGPIKNILLATGEQNGEGQ